MAAAPLAGLRAGVEGEKQRDSRVGTLRMETGKPTP